MVLIWFLGLTEANRSATFAEGVSERPFHAATVSSYTKAADGSAATKPELSTIMRWVVGYAAQSLRCARLHHSFTGDLHYRQLGEGAEPILFTQALSVGFFLHHMQDLQDLLYSTACHANLRSQDTNHAFLSTARSSCA